MTLRPATTSASPWPAKAAGTTLSPSIKRWSGSSPATPARKRRSLTPERSNLQVEKGPQDHGTRVPQTADHRTANIEDSLTETPKQKDGGVEKLQTSITKLQGSSKLQ